MNTPNASLMILLASLVSKHFPQEQESYPTCWRGWEAFKAESEQRGYKLLGNGYFSAAFSHCDSEQVFKVGFKKDDSAAAYVGFCRLNAGAAGIPVIHEVERFDRCYVVVLDKYTEFRTYGDDEAPEALQYMFNRAQYIVETGNSTDWSGTSDYSVGAATLEIAEAREAYAERLFDSALKIHQFFKGIAEFDCHSGNVMINAAGELVITDPVSFTQGIKAWDAIDPAYCGDMREQMFIQRCKERHEGKLNKAARRKEARKEYKEKRRGRKARQFKIKQRDAWMHHEQERAMNMREVGLIGLRTWMDKGWLTLRGIARKHGDANHFAIANAINLPIDDLLQAQFLG